MIVVLTYEHIFSLPWSKTASRFWSNPGFLKTSTTLFFSWNRCLVVLFQPFFTALSQRAENAYETQAAKNVLILPSDPQSVLTSPLLTAGSCGQMMPTSWVTSTAASSSRWSRRLDASSARDTATHRTGWEPTTNFRCYTKIFHCTADC